MATKYPVKPLLLLSGSNTANRYEKAHIRKLEQACYKQQMTSGTIKDAKNQTQDTSAHTRSCSNRVTWSVVEVLGGHLCRRWYVMGNVAGVKEGDLMTPNHLAKCVLV